MTFDSKYWTMSDYAHWLARRLQHQAGTRPLAWEWLIELRAYEWRHGITG